MFDSVQNIQYLLLDFKGEYMKQEMRKGIIMAILAAVLYAVSSPFSKVLLNEMPPTLMAGFLYLGAGIGMSLIAVLRRVRQAEITEIHLSKAELRIRLLWSC